MQPQRFHIIRDDQRRTLRVDHPVHQPVGGLIARLIDHIRQQLHRLGIGLVAHPPECRNHDRDLDDTGSGKGNIRLDGDVLAVLVSKVELLSVLQVQQVDACQPVEPGHFAGSV